MSQACSGLVGDGIIRGVLGAVDCETRSFAQAGYSALTSSSSTFQIALTALLTIYVALVGYRMLFASNGARLSDAPGIALRIGAILALVTSWSTFQTVVFDLAAEAPGQIAGIVAAPMQAGPSSLASNPVEGLQTAYNQITKTAVVYGKMAGNGAKAYSSPQAAAAEALSAASGVLFMTTAGVIAAATLSIGVLTAVGPLFIAMLLIPATRGLFAGWVRAIAAAALTLMLGWLGITLLLSVLEPWLVALAREQEFLKFDPQTGTTTAALVFVFGAGQVALVAGACVTAFGFRLPRANAAVGGKVAPTSIGPAEAAQGETSRAQRLAFDLQREPAGAPRVRTLELASATAPSASRTLRESGAAQPARLGDDYRRPAAEPRRLRISR
jgi:type IV secretion system protein VirB6